LFQRRQRDESRCEFHLKVGRNVPGEEGLETVGALVDRVFQTLREWDIDRSK